MNSSLCMISSKLVTTKHKWKSKLVTAIHQWNSKRKDNFKSDLFSTNDLEKVKVIMQQLKAVDLMAAKNIPGLMLLLPSHRSNQNQPHTNLVSHVLQNGRSSLQTSEFQTTCPICSHWCCYCCMFSGGWTCVKIKMSTACLH